MQTLREIMGTIRFLAGMIVLMLLVAAGSQSCARAAEPVPPDVIRARGVLRIGTTEDYPPFSFRDPASGALAGFDIDQAKSLAGAMGVKVQFVRTRWSDLLRDFNAGKFDVVMGGLTVTAERMKAGSFSIPYLDDGKAAIARCADKERFATLSAINQSDVRLIVDRGGTSEMFVHSNIRSAQIIAWSDHRTLFDQLVSGKADVAVTDASETRYQQKFYPGTLCAIHPDRPFNAIQKAYLIRSSPALVEFVNRWILQSRQDGSYARTVQFWF
jgi:cyclohexadienyl dehydratase